MPDPVRMSAAGLLRRFTHTDARGVTALDQPHRDPSPAVRKKAGRYPAGRWTVPRPDLRRATTPAGTVVLSGGGVYEGGSALGPMRLLVGGRLVSARPPRPSGGRIRSARRPRPSGIWRWSTHARRSSSRC